MPLKYISTVH